MTPINTLSYEGTPIRLRGAMLNLTDMWNAAGRPENRRPTDWLSLEETHRFRAHADTHLNEAAASIDANADLVGIHKVEPDRFVATARGHGGGTWAHWQLALSYGRYLSPPFHLWCNTVVRAAMERRDRLPAVSHDRLLEHITGLFRRVHRRIDTLDRHAADLMFLQLSAQEVVTGQRRSFSGLSQALIIRAVAGEPFNGRCPCCTSAPVLTEEGRPVAGAEFDHFFHRGLNRPEHGWLICQACHHELTHGGYVAHFERMPEFRRFQAAVLAQRARTQRRPVPLPRRAPPSLSQTRPPLAGGPQSPMTSPEVMGLFAFLASTLAWLARQAGHLMSALRPSWTRRDSTDLPKSGHCLARLVQPGCGGSGGRACHHLPEDPC